MVKEIKLTQGKVALVDDEHFEELNKFKWCIQQDKWNIYARRRATKKERMEGSPTQIRLHRALLEEKYGKEALEGKVVDHINHNGLDNTLANLRISSLRENQHNQRKSKNNTSGYKGVNAHGERWRAQIYVGGKNAHLGLFTCKHEAAEAYNAAALHYYKDYAHLNVIEREKPNE